MNLFFDTSAFVKYFFDETGSVRVREIVDDSGNNLYVFELVRLEFLSAIHRKFRSKEIAKETRDEWIDLLDESLDFWSVEPFSEYIFTTAEELVKSYGNEYGLRALDALHLAAFKLLADKNWGFVCSDDNLLQVASTLGYKTINPITGE